MSTAARPASSLAAPIDVIAVDLGGTQLRTALFVGDVMTHRWSIPTPAGATAVVDALVAQIEAAREVAGGTVGVIGVSALGPVDPDAGIIRDAPTIPDFTDVAIRALVQERVGLPVVVVNDANAATLAEWRLGAGRGSADFCFVTVSTGIGSGFVSGGRLLTGRSGAAGELGRIQVRAPGDVVARRLEEHASGTGIAARATALAAGHEPLSGVLAAHGRITARDVVELAEAGDSVCRGVLDAAGAMIGESLGHIVRLLDPEVIAIGGGLSHAGTVLWGPLIAAFDESLGKDGIPSPRLVPAQLHDDAGLHGATIVARSRAVADGRLEE